jgi:tetrahydromethanopterin S-methyltransferase subunit A
MRDVAGAAAQDTRRTALRVIREQLAEAAAAPKCHGCGCLHGTVETIERTPLGEGELAAAVAEARQTFAPKKYECLGCAVCYPAIAANHLAEAFPELVAGLDVCPTEAPVERRGWPPLPGDYRVVRYRAPVAVCTLGDAELTARLAQSAPEGLAIAGTLHTENLGIERIIRNVLANPFLRFLILCGEDTRQAVGHFPGQSLASLFASGLDERGRIQGARGKRPVLKNVRRDQVEAFLGQVELVPLVGVQDEAAILDAIRACAGRPLAPFEGAPLDTNGVSVVTAQEPRSLVTDPAGFLVVYPDASRGFLLLEHYTNAGVLDCVLEGGSPAAVYREAIERKLVSRLDHAAYLGRELARAERSLETGERYVQDRAPGEASPEPPPIESSPAACGCAHACGGGVKP